MCTLESHVHVQIYAHSPLSLFSLSHTVSNTHTHTHTHTLSLSIPLSLSLSHIPTHTLSPKHTHIHTSHSLCPHTHTHTHTENTPDIVVNSLLEGGTTLRPVSHRHLLPLIAYYYSEGEQPMLLYPNSALGTLKTLLLNTRETRKHVRQNHLHMYIQMIDCTCIMCIYNCCSLCKYMFRHFHCNQQHSCMHIIYILKTWNLYTAI